MSAPRSAIVVAHPDDECLWLSSVLAGADAVVFCFGDQFERPKSSAARRQAVAALPLKGLVDLKLPESGAGFSVDWTDPRPTEAGIAIADATARGRYEGNFPKLVAALRPVLTGCADVYTHNPWGEYGHAEHIQVYRAVAALQAELGFTIWFSNYVGPVSTPFMLQVSEHGCWASRREVQSDRVLARRLMKIYRRHRAWTWTRWHRWPPRETLYAQPPAASGEALRPLDGEWLLDATALRWWSPPSLARRLIARVPPPLELLSGSDE